MVLELRSEIHSFLLITQGHGDCPCCRSGKKLPRLSNILKIPQRVTGGGSCLSWSLTLHPHAMSCDQWASVA